MTVHGIAVRCDRAIARSITLAVPVWLRVQQASCMDLAVRLILLSGEQQVIKPLRQWPGGSVRRLLKLPQYRARGSQAMLHTIILQLHEGPRLRDCLDYLRSFGPIRIVFPGREYKSMKASDEERAREPGYETARLLPRGGDGGFAEQFLRERSEGS
jgi:hypothetical protein